MLFDFETTNSDVLWWKRRYRTIRGVVSVFGFKLEVCEELYFKYAIALDITREEFLCVIMVLKWD